VRRLRTLPPLRAKCLKILEASTSWSPKGQSWPVQGQLYLYHLLSLHTRFLTSGGFVTKYAIKETRHTDGSTNI